MAKNRKENKLSNNLSSIHVFTYFANLPSPETTLLLSLSIERHTLMSLCSLVDFSPQRFQQMLCVIPDLLELEKWGSSALTLNEFLKGLLTDLSALLWYNSSSTLRLMFGKHEHHCICPPFHKLSLLSEEESRNHLPQNYIKKPNSLGFMPNPMICSTSSKLDATIMVTCDYYPNVLHKNPPWRAGQVRQGILCLKPLYLKNYFHKGPN